MKIGHLLWSIVCLNMLCFGQMYGQCFADAGADDLRCGTSYQLNANSSGAGFWTGTGSFANPNDPNTIVSVSSFGTYVFTWNVNEPDCQISDDVIITFGDHPTDPFAGNDITICGLSYTLQGNHITTGTGVWSGPGSFSDSSHPNSVVTVPSYGTYTFTWNTSNCNCPVKSDAVTITFAEQGPAPYAGPDDATCSLSYTLQGSGSGVWSSSSAGVVFSNPTSPNSTVTVPAPGTYTFSWSAANACGSNTDFVTIQFGGSLDADVCDDKVICRGEMVGLFASGGTSYSWSPASSLNNPTSATPLAFPTSSTVYTVVISNGGCSTTEQVVVTVNPTPFAQHSEPVCNNDGTFSINLDISGGSGTYSVTGTGITGSITAYEDQPFDLVIQHQEGVSYSFTYEDVITGCGLTLTIPPVECGPCEIEDATICEDRTICRGESVQLNAGGGLSYSWSPANGLSNPNIYNPIATPNATTTYTVTITDAYGCTAEMQVTVFVIDDGNVTVDAGASQQICGLTAQLNAIVTGGGAGSWSGGPGVVFSNSNSPSTSVTVDDFGTYVFTYTVSGQCGSASDDVVITFDDHPTPAFAGNDDAVCGTLTYNLNGNTPLIGEGSWSGDGVFSDPSNPNSSVTVSGYGTYTFSWITTNCECPPSRDDVTITFYDNAFADAGSDREVCGSSFAMQASGGPGTWSVIQGSGTFSNVSDPNSIVTNLSFGANVFQWSVQNGPCSASDQVTITVVNGTHANAGADQDVCSGGSVQLNASGGVTYQWSPATGLSNPNIANPTASPATTTTYTVTVTDANGCVDSDQVTVTVQPRPFADAGPDASVCRGGSTQLNASGGTFYSWSPAEGLSNASSQNPIASPAVTTTYTVTVTSAHGCTNTDQVTVTVLPGPTAYAGEDVSICAGGFVRLGASGGLYYQWSPPTGLDDPTSANPYATPTTTTTYTVTVTDANGCMDTDQVTVTVRPNPNADAGPDREICMGGFTQLQGSGGVFYSWSPAKGLDDATSAMPFATPSQTTTYTLTVTDEHGCVGTDQVTVTVRPNPVISAGPDQSICLGGFAQLTASGGLSYTWSPATGLDNPNSATPIATPVATTTYTVTATDAFGCSNSDQVTVVIHPNPIANAGNDQSICQGGFTQLFGSGGISYSWSPATGLDDPGSASPFATPVTTTTYTLTVTDVNGCRDTDQVTVTVHPNPFVDAGADQSICTGASTQLSATGGISYNWSPSAGLDNPSSATPIASPQVTTTYTVTATDANGCSNSDQVTVTVHPSPIANAGADQSICQGGFTQLFASGGVFYSWSPATGLDDPSSAAPFATPATTTTYTVTVTDANGCRDTDDVTVIVHPAPFIDAGPDQSICPGGFAQLNASGAISYNWTPASGLSNPNIANPTATPSTTTTYTVTATDANGCTSSDQVTVIVHPSPVANAGPDRTICAGGFTQLTGSGGLYYNWSPPKGLDDPTSAMPYATPMSTTTYTLTVTDANGCTSSDQVTIFVNPAPLVDAGNDVTICAGGSAQMHAIGGVTYSWFPPTGLSNPNIADPMASPTVTTTYDVTITDANGCSDIDRVTVTVGPNPQAFANGGTICMGESITLSAGGGTSYSWSPATGLSNPFIANPVATPSATTTYTVLVTNEHGCSSTATATVVVNPYPSAAAILNVDDMICGSSTTLTAAAVSSGSGSWSAIPSAGVSFSNPNSPSTSVSVTSFGDYTFVWTVSSSCGSSSDQVDITFGDHPTPAYAGPDDVTCALSYQLNANTPLVGTGNWAGPGVFSDVNDPNATVTVLAPGTYTFIWRTTNCDCPESTDEVTVTFQDCTPVCEEVIDICTNVNNATQFCLEWCDLDFYDTTNYFHTDACNITETSPGCIIFDPRPDYTGLVTVLAVACNSQLAICDTIYVNVTVGNCGGNTVVAVDDHETTDINTPVTIDVLGNDYDPDGDSFSITDYTQPSNGSVVLVGDQFVYTPNPGFTGTDSFTYTIVDEHGNIDIAVVTITIEGQCENILNYCTAPLTPIELCINFCSLTGGKIVEAHTLFNCSINILGDNCIRYTPLPGFEGTDLVEIVGCDTQGNCETVYVNILVGDCGQNPCTVVANAGADQTVCSGLALPQVQLQASGGVSYSWSPVTGLSDPNIANPTLDVTGSATYTVTVTDGQGCTDTDDVNITLAGPAVINNITDPVCNSNGTFSIQVTASGGTGNYNILGDGIPAGTTATANVPVTITLPGDGTSFYSIYATDAVTGCADDIVYPIEPVSCPVDGECEDQINICAEPVTPVDICVEFCTIDNATATLGEIESTYHCATQEIGGLCFRYTALPGFEGNDIVTVEGCDASGACETIYVVVNVTENCGQGKKASSEDQCEPDVTNFISPNNDGINDELKILNTACFESVHLKVINQFGVEMFNAEGTPENVAWDGLSEDGNELRSGTYYYILSTTSIEGYKGIHTGFIELKYMLSR